MTVSTDQIDNVTVTSEIKEIPQIITPNNEILCTGEYLKKCITETKESREFFINSLIPKISIIQFYAPDGIGKSTILTQIALEATSGGLVFGGLPCSQPVKVLLLPTERPRQETFERIRLMMDHINIKWENIAVEEMLGYDVMNYNSREDFIKKVIGFISVFNPDIVVIDPIYAIVSTDIDNKSAGAINTALLRIQAVAKVTIAYTHHSNRGVRDSDGNRKKQDMYGGRFISAKCTGVFKIEESENGTIITNEKDTYSCLASKINLKFDHETYLSTMDESQSFECSSNKMKCFIMSCYESKKDFTFDQIAKVAGVSTSIIREFMGGEVKKGNIINLKPKGAKALYKVVRYI